MLYQINKRSNIFKLILVFAFCIKTIAAEWLKNFTAELHLHNSALIFLIVLHLKSTVESLQKNAELLAFFSFNHSAPLICKFWQTKRISSAAGTL